MKRVYSICLSALIVITVSCNEDDTVIVNNVTESCLPSNLQEGLIAAYPFNGGNLNDAIGSAELTASNVQSTTDRQGNPDCAYAFEGNLNSYLTSQDTEFLNNLDEMTVALWYLPQGDYFSFELLLGRGEGYSCDAYGEWSLGVYDSRKAVFGHGNSVWEQVNPIGPNQWKFATATVNKSDNTISIYINGILEETGTGFISCHAGGPLMTVEDVGDLLIGTKFNGKIDDIVIYNRILSQAEITQLYELAPCCQ